MPGWATAPATSSPACQSATCTAQSSRGGSENSRVPSSGSMIQTRSAVEPVAVGDAGLALLRQHRVVGTVRGAQRHQQVVGGQVAGVLELLALEPLGADLGQQLAGHRGGPGREGVVVGAGGGRGDGKARVLAHDGNLLTRVHDDPTVVTRQWALATPLGDQ